MDSKSKIQPEIIDRQDTLDEYCFSNPGPSDSPKRNFWIDESGHIRVKNLSGAHHGRKVYRKDGG